jgi:hypothetical protein
MNRTELESRAQLWQRHRAWHAALVSTAVGLVASSLLLRASLFAAVLIGIAAGLGALIFLRRRTSAVTAATLAAHLNRLYPTLEESAGLWLRDPATLALVERLQLQRVDAAWNALTDRGTAGLPRTEALRPAIGWCAAAAIALIAVISWPSGNAPTATTVQSIPEGSAQLPNAVPPTLRTALLEIEAPGYLGQPSRLIDGLDAEVPEGSAVTWRLEFNGSVAGVALISAGSKGELGAAQAEGGAYNVRNTITETQLYQLAITSHDGSRVVWPELHVLKVVRDLSPRLTWQEPSTSRTVIDPAAGPPRVAVRLSAVDDHGLAAVSIVMTVAKGSGEGVKFREQEVPLERIAPSTGAGGVYGRTLDLTALGLEPGDELYFHGIATDRRTPKANQARTETRFVVLRGPATELAAPPAGIAGVNRLPQYFRSQRQLIIDTERLIADRGTLSDETFRQRSEEIGIDQKLLRLRYGQFLGEEFEPPSSGAPKEAQGMALAGALRGESRESLNRTAAVERAVEAQHAHSPASDREGRLATVEELMAPFVHVHDNAEAATLFNEHVKTALRAVLAAMWEAEGFLRTARAAEALPAENRALELLKALQQADRVYVKRVGYEPAPIKVDERRLRGELDTIPKRATSTPPQVPPSVDAMAVSAAIGVLGEASVVPIPEEMAAAVEAQLVANAQERPETLVAAFELWRRRSSGTLTPAERAALRRALWSLLPPVTELPHRRGESAPALAAEYIEALSTTPPRSP